MFTFWSFGTLMEATFGRWEFTALYFGGMIFSSAYDFVKYRNNVYYQSIGASGAVSAVLFSSILLNPWGTILLFAVIPIPGILFGILYLAYCRYMARQASDHINHNAHFYGALYGLVFPVLLHPSLIPLFLSRLTDLPWLK
jgi:membrane associated rhomboid family serine protease